jgi:hypothetical protein
MDDPPFICISPLEDSVSSFVNHDPLEVCLLSQRNDLPLSATLQSGLRFLQPPLPAASPACLTATACPKGRDIGLLHTSSVVS